VNRGLREEKMDGQSPAFADRALDRALEHLRAELGKSKS